MSALTKRKKKYHLLDKPIHLLYLLFVNDFLILEIDKIQRILYMIYQDSTLCLWLWHKIS